MQGSEGTTRWVYESFKQVQYTVKTLMSKPVQMNFLKVQSLVGMTDKF